MNLKDPATGLTMDELTYYDDKDALALSCKSQSAGSANLDCEIENCFKNFFGVCFVAGDLGCEKCDKYNGDAVAEKVECKDCGVMCVPEFIEGGLCPLCGDRMA